MSKSYYKLLYRLDGIDRYLLWFTNDVDGVITNAAGRVVAFPTEASLIAFAQSHDYTVQDEDSPMLLNLDTVSEWAASPRADTLDCVVTLTAWNLIGDVARSAAGEGTSFLDADRRMFDIYDKVFWGNNLPAMTPPGERYVPSWTDEEIERIASLLNSGVELVQTIRAGTA